MPQSPRSAARTIKRIVTKKYAQGKYRNYTETGYISIRRGKMPSHKAAILRRMKTYPIYVRTPIYRGIRSLNRFVNGKLTNYSFSSFSNNNNTARHFSNYGGFSKGGYLLVLKPGKYPGINRRKFIHNNEEREITLAPGTFEIINKNNNKKLIHVRYTPLNNRSPR